MTEQTIRTAADVFAHFGVTYEPSKSLEENNKVLSRRVFKDTPCGAWAKLIEGESGLRFLCGSIVEGTDAEVNAGPVMLPCSPEDLDEALSAVEEDVQTIWNQTHGCDGCEKLYGDGWSGQVMADCRECEGGGVVL